MKNSIGLVLVLTTVGFSACTLNVGTTANSANVPASNKPTSDAAKSGETSARSDVPKPNTVGPESTERTGGERVKFDAGENSSSITRDIPANGSLDFLINAKKGQPMGLQMGYEGKTSDIEGFLTEPGSQDISLTFPADSRKEFKVKTSGDHRLTVNNKSGKKVTFTLYVDIY